MRPNGGAGLVVAVGASSGGFDACKAFFGAVRTGEGAAYILVLHLDPSHESMMVELLVPHTPLKVVVAEDMAEVMADTCYVIAPGAYLTLVNGVLRVRNATDGLGARLPFDVLLQSVARDFGGACACVVLSGAGSDGTEGLKFVSAAGGKVLAQSPADAEYAGMPQSAIATGLVDRTASAGQLPAVLTRLFSLPEGLPAALPDMRDRGISKIISLLKARTAHDFTHYKTGTLGRRIERRMAIAGLSIDQLDDYLALLQSDPAELELLASDLLINVTSFFRDPLVFNALADKVIPPLLDRADGAVPIRLWVAGCSTGEEAYSWAILLTDAIRMSGRRIRVQIFASDVDPVAVAFAREGLYPAAIARDVSESRLARYFTLDGTGYRISPEIRALVNFTVQDLLLDPPFAKLDVVSCRNVLIYLSPKAQDQVIGQFHFALLDGGLLLLGASETVDAGDPRFELMSKGERLYRQIGKRRSTEIVPASGPVSPARVAGMIGQASTLSRQAVLEELCRKSVLDHFAPASVLVNRRMECLFSLGPIDRYLHVAPGRPSNDLLAMARPAVRAQLRSAAQQAALTRRQIVIYDARLVRSDAPGRFNIVVEPLESEGESLLLVLFIDILSEPLLDPGPAPIGDHPQIAALERELDSTRGELGAAISDLERSGENQKAINEEARSLQEEYQSTNEELLTSKEELQSLNEELTALNSQLHETLERQRTTSNDLENVLFSTNVATVFLDDQMRIRFFTPATKNLLSIIPGDIGRPLADLSLHASDPTLLRDAADVLRTHTVRECEIAATDGDWFMRRVHPYRARNGKVEGVVITFSDTTEQRHAAESLGIAKREAELATIFKSRFLAAASHDLRQPLQTLSLLQALLAKTVQGEKAVALMGRLDETLAAMGGMLNAMLDINQIESGTVRPNIAAFPVNELLDQLGSEFAYHARARGLGWKTVGCSQMVQTDRHLLEQMLRNLISNALKYTNQGRVLMGCRRSGQQLRIEVWDTGIGIPPANLQTIFTEYQQLDNNVRDPSRGLGLGLSIVQRFANILKHRITVRSVLDKGTVFTIEIDLAPVSNASLPPPDPAGEALPAAALQDRRNAVILIIEDDPEVRGTLDLALRQKGHRTEVASGPRSAFDLINREAIRPDLIVADYNLAASMTGVQVISEIRHMLGGAELPAIVLTGDIANATLADIADNQCHHLNKPVRFEVLGRTIQSVLTQRHVRPLLTGVPTPLTGHADRSDNVVRPRVQRRFVGPLVYLVDDDFHVREGIQSVLEDDGWQVESYASCEAFLENYQPGQSGCLLLDAYLPGMDGMELLQELRKLDDPLPTIMITGNSDVSMAVQAMKAGAADFIEKPISRDDLLEAINKALQLAGDSAARVAGRDVASERLASLTPRQREIMEMVLAGQPNKNIAADLGISQRTVENHRASIMHKTGSKSLPALVRLALTSSGGG